MSQLKVERLEEYLTTVYKKKSKVLRVVPLKGEKSQDLKEFGYGVPYYIEFVVGQNTKCVVLETMRPEGFGHDHFSDRAAILLWQHFSFNSLPNHVHSVDVGAFTSDDETLKSLGDCREFFIVTEFAEGELYHSDLDRIKSEAGLMSVDEERCVALSGYLAKIHSTKKNAPELYLRRIRDLLGHGEGIFGLTDSYPKNLGYVDETYFTELEKACVEWRWQLKNKTRRLSQVHGDFHPWNIMFKKGSDFAVLDRSRGEWGEPADDVTAMTINYIFYSLRKYGRLTGAFERLFNLFWQNYLQKTGDEEILEVVQPFYAWRGLVVASPIWYPNLKKDVRVNLLNLVRNILESEKFDLNQINNYIEHPTASLE